MVKGLKHVLKSYLKGFCLCLPAPRLPFVLQTLLLLQGQGRHPSFRMTGKVSTEGWGPCWERRMGSLGTSIEPWLCYRLLFWAWHNCAGGGITPFEDTDTKSQRGKQFTPRVISIRNSKPIWHQLPKCRLFKDLCGCCSLSHPPGSFSFPHTLHCAAKVVVHSNSQTQKVIGQSCSRQDCQQPMAF